MTKWAKKKRKKKPDNHEINKTAMIVGAIAVVGSLVLAMRR